MGLLETIKGLPSAALNALKDYLSGLQLFFNRRTWSHGAVFIITILFFSFFRFLQPFMQGIYWLKSPLMDFILSMVFRTYLAGCAVFIAFLLLGLMALTSPGRHLLYESRVRHLISPLAVGGLILLFNMFTNRTHVLGSPLLLLLFAPNGIFELIFRGCSIVIVILQVSLLGYAIITTLKWLWGYLRVPQSSPPSTSQKVTTIFLLILVPIAIWEWLPFLTLIMIPPGQPIIINEQVRIIILILVPQVLWLLEQSPKEYVYYLLAVSPLPILASAIALSKHRPKLALALAGFAPIYPVIIYYYRLRVAQYFHMWSATMSRLAPPPYPGSGLFEMGLLLVTFLMVLQGAAKLQRNISLNPFGLFALMVGALVGAYTWMFDPEMTVPLWFSVEIFNMFSLALSAFLGLLVFALLPLSYAIYRIKRPPEEEGQETKQPLTPTEGRGGRRKPTGERR